ncbi:amidohydrolase [Aliifodinibius salicampi]|uniref:Amidohydrolase n=1 Tax=Fodinibius salicampi TaxID=1920655 RepID=A0ABT3Q346_9BACT|nr:amidohydrolase [Fodinibius salicampi]MCW9714501.1 amidohydrolase [Fodinibius salicampi]
MPFEIEQYIPELKKLRHRLHAEAEISGSEKQTAQIIQEFLSDTNPDDIQSNIGGHGILATYLGEANGPHILLRCELDALPIKDKIDASYKSRKEGVGHKCGHDGHMSIVCGVANILGEEGLSSGQVSLLFQPSEETGEGAMAVLENQKFKKLNPDYCFALHNLPGYEKHQVVIREGIFAAASAGLAIHFYGETSHAAHPEEGKSPALAVGQLIQSLSSVPQFYSSLDQAVKVTVVNVELGEEAYGTSPAEATVRVTLRTYDDGVLNNLQDRCVQIAEGLASTYDLEIEHDWVQPFAALVNDSKAVKVIRESAENQNLKVLRKELPFNWSEDFGYFLKEIPGAMFGLGSGEGHPPLHAGSYDFPDEIIVSGVKMFMQIIKETVSE